ncbi:MAG: hypothetical protein M3Y74_02475, partial [Chloroflexota bacterium]|nr:hypothetical protein [Chloroflexota bacterium]
DAMQPSSQDTRTVDIPRLADGIRRLFVGQKRSPILRDIYVALANSDVFVEEIDRALRHLKKNKLADFNDQRASSAISFRT